MLTKGQMKIIYDAEKQKVPIKLWLEDIEEGAMQQAMNLANLPFVFKHVAIMPDSHQGYGMPIGGVIATEKVIIPNAVGVDIGCGMCAVKTSIKVEQLDNETLKNIMNEIRKKIPVGKIHQKEEQDQALMPMLLMYNSRVPICSREYRSALKQLGTLGGGNHFIEIQKDTNGYVWIMIHSGSRNLGKQVADHYNKVAIRLNEEWYSSVPKEWQLAFLPMDSEEGEHYLSEMKYCVLFALANRKLMMDRILDIFRCSMIKDGMVTIVDNEPMINIAHNYARMENHFGKNVMIHRKGATSADPNDIGIIPGSQGTKSYIIKGKGNPESFMSCSHGAGRKMSRTKAQNELNLCEEIKKLDDQGIIHGIRHKNDLDEATGAYKDIDTVMENQKDLVEIITELTPLAVIKG